MKIIMILKYYFIWLLLGVVIGAVGMALHLNNELKIIINSNLAIGLVGAIVGATASYVFLVWSDNVKIKMAAFVALQDIAYFICYFKAALERWQKSKPGSLDNHQLYHMPLLSFPILNKDNISERLNLFLLILKEKMAQDEKEEFFEQVISIDSMKAFFELLNEAIVDEDVVSAAHKTLPTSVAIIGSTLTQIEEVKDKINKFNKNRIRLNLNLHFPNLDKTKDES